MFTDKRRVSILDSFRKATKVIASCETNNHLQGAQKYANNFLSSYSETTDDWIANHPVIEADPFVDECYRRLLTQIRVKREELSI